MVDATRAGLKQGAATSTSGQSIPSASPPTNGTNVSTAPARPVRLPPPAEHTIVIHRGKPRGNVSIPPGKQSLAPAMPGVVLRQPEPQSIAQQSPASAPMAVTCSTPSSAQPESAVSMLELSEIAEALNCMPPEMAAAMFENQSAYEVARKLVLVSTEQAGRIINHITKERCRPTMYLNLLIHFEKHHSSVLKDHSSMFVEVQKSSFHVESEREWGNNLFSVDVMVHLIEAISPAEAAAVIKKTMYMPFMRAWVLGAMLPCKAALTIKAMSLREALCTMRFMRHNISQELAESLGSDFMYDMTRMLMHEMVEALDMPVPYMPDLDKPGAAPWLWQFALLPAPLD